MNDDQLIPVRVWDLPTRLFHWSLAVCVAISIISANIGGNAMVWHFRFGYAVFALLLFRLAWGLGGGHWSRFRSFTYAPSTTLRYLRGTSRPEEHHHVGHNPLGAFSVFGLIAVLAAQVGTGLFADDEIANTGPLIKFVTESTSGRLTGWHKGWGQWLVYTLVALHIAAILFYWLKKRQNLVGPMLIGDKRLTRDVPASIDNLRSRSFALVLIGLAALLVGWIVNLGG